MKKVLILCTGNSCRSIIAEALVNAKLEGIAAESSGVRASGRVNPNAEKLLKEKGIWEEHYHSKTLDTVIDNDYDLVVTVCDHAKETCPMFTKPVKTIHVGFEDPDGKGFDAFEKTYKEIETTLLPKIMEALVQENKMNKNVFKTSEGVKISFTGTVEKQNIVKMVQNYQTGQCECMSEETKQKITDMQVKGSDGDVALELSGDVSKEEIEAALKRSKVLNP